MEYSIFRDHPQCAIVSYLLLHSNRSEEPSIRDAISKKLGYSNDRTLKKYLSDLQLLEIIEKERGYGLKNVWKLLYCRKSSELIIEILNKLEENDHYDDIIEIFKSIGYQNFLNSDVNKEDVLFLSKEWSSGDDDPIFLNICNDALAVLPSFIFHSHIWDISEKNLKLRNFLYYKETHIEDDSILRRGLDYWDIIECVGTDRLYIDGFVGCEKPDWGDSEVIVNENMTKSDIGLEMLKDINAFVEKWGFILDPMYEHIEKSLKCHSVVKLPPHLNK